MSSWPTDRVRKETTSSGRLRRCMTHRDSKRSTVSASCVPRPIGRHQSNRGHATAGTVGTLLWEASPCFPYGPSGLSPPGWRGGKSRISREPERQTGTPMEAFLGRGRWGGHGLWQLLARLSSIAPGIPGNPIKAQVSLGWSLASKAERDHARVPAAWSGLLTRGTHSQSGGC